MKAFITLVVLAAACWFGYQHYQKNGLPGATSMSQEITLESDRLLMSSGDLVAEFDRTGTFFGSYMIFGGLYLADKNAVSSVNLSGLPIREATRIYKQYPDFHLCKSPGASIAKRFVENLNIIPADGSVVRTLRKTLESHKTNVAKGGDQVCVRIEGERAYMRSVEIPSANENVTHAYPNRDFYYVTGAELLNCKDELDAGSQT